MDYGAWNTEDFDPSLLNWTDPNDDETDRKEEEQKTSPPSIHHQRSRSSPANTDTINWDVSLNNDDHTSSRGFARLPSFSLDEAIDTAPSERSTTRSLKSSRGDQEDGASTPLVSTHPLDSENGEDDIHVETSLNVTEEHPISTSDSMTSSSRSNPNQQGSTTASTSASSATTNQNQGESQPSILETSNNSVGDHSASQLHPLGIPSSANCPPHSSIPAMDTTTPAAPQQQDQLSVGLPSIHPLPQVAPAQQTNSLQFQEQLSQEYFTTYAATLAALQQAHQQSLIAAATAAIQPQPSTEQQQYFVPTATGSPPLQLSAASLSVDSPSEMQPQSLPAVSSRGRGGGKRGRKPKARKGSTAAGSSAKDTNSDKLPPFYLFDAPVELRANFQQQQRKLGIPVLEDCNSYHYGQAVKGFHPQANMNASQLEHLQQAPAPVRLIDARNNAKHRQNLREKNEREQKRAQKITELIDQLRVSMEDGGWKKDMRSKFETLSSCSGYVKHLSKSVKEKEAALEKLRSDIEAKRNGMMEEKTMQGSRSDPESVISNLTSSSNGSSPNGRSREKLALSGQKRPAEASGEASKRHRTTGNTPYSSATDEMSSGDDKGSGLDSTQNQKHSSIDKAFSSVSDITDSNRGSSANSGTSGSDDRTENASGNQKESVSSVSSDAAVHSGSGGDKVKSGSGSRRKSNRKRPPREVTSIERNFELDYEEVFDQSNIPQLIATTSGKIVTWNDCFLKASGFKKNDIENMTIFSLVKPEKLASFFEIVATALKSERPVNEESIVSRSTDNEKPQSEQDKETATESSRSWDYTTMTLPCIKFPSMRKRCQASGLSRPVDPLFITVTLMEDEDPHRRCFHCVFTNSRGKDGALGSITPEFLELLFSVPEQDQKSGRESKRARMTNVSDQKEEDKAKLEAQRDTEDNDDGDDEDEDDEEDDGDNSDSDQARSSTQSTVKSGDSD